MNDIENLKLKLIDLARLTPNWDNFNALKIDSQAILNSLDIIKYFPKQYKLYVFACTNGNVQFEIDPYPVAKGIYIIIQVEVSSTEFKLLKVGEDKYSEKAFDTLEITLDKKGIISELKSL